MRPGFLTRDEILHRYSTRTGRDVSAMPYYWAWAHWKTATVVEQIYVRYVRGQTTDPRFALMGPMAPRARARRLPGSIAPGLHG